VCCNPPPTGDSTLIHLFAVRAVPPDSSYHAVPAGGLTMLPGGLPVNGFITKTVGSAVVDLGGAIM